MIATAVQANGAPFAGIALLSGCLVGALLRVLVGRTLRPPASNRTVWITELAAALLFGVVLALPIDSSLRPSLWDGTSFAGALGAYPGACAVSGLISAQLRGDNLLAPAVAHFIASTAAMSAGFIAGDLALLIILR